MVNTVTKKFYMTDELEGPITGLEARVTKAVTNELTNYTRAGLKVHNADRLVIKTDYETPYEYEESHFVVYVELVVDESVAEKHIRELNNIRR